MKIGETCDPFDAGEKDAIHVPIVICTSDDDLQPGDKVRFLTWEFPRVQKCTEKDSNAIVDPFAKEIPKGCAFIVLIKPGLVSQLKHTWTIEGVGEVGAEEGTSCGECFNDGP